MSAIDIGLYFGGSSMVLGFFRDDKAQIIVNEAGDRTTPSVVALNGSEFSVGLPAKQNLIRNASNTVCHAKHFIGKNKEKMDENIIKRNDNLEIKTLTDNEVAFVLEKSEKPFDFSLAEAIEKQMKYLNDLTKNSLGVKECNTVLAVPCFFTSAQTDFLATCAEKVGFNVLRMIKNPLAACLAYDLEDDNTKESTVLVYQMGGSTIEVTLLSVSNGLYKKIDSVSLTNLGGDNFIDVIIDVLCEEFQRKYKSNPRTNKRSVSKLKSIAEELMSVLSTMERSHCSIECLFDGHDFDYYLTRQRFEGACSKLYQQVLQPIDDLLSANKLAATQVNQVILCGAATNMSKIQQLIGQKFEGSQLLKQKSPEEVIALGCAKQCALITNSKIKQISKQDSSFKCLSSPIFLKVGNKANTEKIQIFSSQIALPLKRDINIESDLKHPTLSVMESDNKVLATINLKEFTTKEITAHFMFKLNETLEICVTEVSSGKKITVFLNSEVAAEI